jgi:mono/diheme cytochrome c family protein
MRLLAVVAAVLVLAVGALAGFVWSGAYEIAADRPHWPATAALMRTVRERAVTARAREVAVPADLADAGRIRRGAGNYDAMCAGCHLKPGLDDSEIRKGLYPQPPNLASTGGDAARQFWVIKHGLKMTGMPAWSRGGMDDAAIWDMVALLQRLPQLSPDDYAALVAASEGHTHAGAGGNREKTGSPDHVDAPGAPPHKH